MYIHKIYSRCHDIPIVLHHKSVEISTFLVRTEDQEARCGDCGAPEAK